MALFVNKNDRITIDGYGQRVKGLAIVEQMTVMIWLPPEGYLHVTVGKFSWQGFLDEMLDALALIHGTDTGQVIRASHLYLKSESEKQRTNLWLFLTSEGGRLDAIAKVDRDQFSDAVTQLASNRVDRETF